MTTFVQVSDPALPDVSPWWMALLPRNDHDTLLAMHRTFTKHMWILDGRDPHMQAERARAQKADEFSVAYLRHPVVLSGHWLTTALSLFTRSDVLVSSKGGMRPRDKSVTELGTLRSRDWPAVFNSNRHIQITTWGNHFYLVCRNIAFSEKWNTEAEAMAQAKLFAPAANITVRREARSFREGD